MSNGGRTRQVHQDVGDFSIRPDFPLHIRHRLLRFRFAPVEHDHFAPFFQDDFTGLVAGSGISPGDQEGLSAQVLDAGGGSSFLAEFSGTRCFYFGTGGIVWVSQLSLVVLRIIGSSLDRAKVRGRWRGVLYGITGVGYFLGS